ncbi:MAG: beta-N-acetylhexosaminidase [Myxococcales bacterium]|nr:beta-N-acetylhexosaminidase [Myxococcales bacterium]
MRRLLCGWFSACLILFSTAQVQALKLPKNADEIDIEKVISQMSLREKVGQLLLIGFPGTRVTSHMRSWINDRKVGGVVLFSRNLVDFEQTARFTRDLQDLTRGHIPLFLALDQEGGNVVRVKEGTILLPSNMALGATRSSTLSYVAGQALAVDLRLMGFNMNLAPVLDVNSNPKNPVIGIRSYGEKADLVANLGSWYVRGQQEMGVAAVAKHFPGHGDTHSDSHFSMPSIDADRARLSKVELKPFKRAVESGLDAIMTAHIALPRISEEPDLPATLSKNIIDGLLRKQLGYDGLVLTDGLEMQAIVQSYGSGTAAVMAIQAGADMPMILWTADKQREVYSGIIQAVKDGRISQKRLDQSVRRILEAKFRRRLFHREVEPLKSVLKKRNRNEVHAQVAQRIAREAVTLVRNRGEFLPLSSEDKRKMLVVAPRGAFAKAMAKRPNTKVIALPYSMSRRRRAKALRDVSEALRKADAWIIAASNRYHIAIGQKAAKAFPNKPFAFLSFASPYFLNYLPNASAYVCTYSYLKDAQKAAAAAVLGEYTMSGKLPVTIPGMYSYDHRIEQSRDLQPRAKLNIEEEIPPASTL